MIIIKGDGGVKRKIVVRFLIILLCLSVMMTVANIVILFFKMPILIPIANYGIVALVWLHYVYDSLYFLGVGLLLLCLMLYSLGWVIVKRSVFFPVVSVYLMDFLIAICMLINGWEWSAVSILMDIIIVVLAISNRLEGKGRGLLFP